MGLALVMADIPVNGEMSRADPRREQPWPERKMGAGIAAGPHFRQVCDPRLVEEMRSSAWRTCPSSFSAKAMARMCAGSWPRAACRCWSLVPLPDVHFRAHSVTAFSGRPSNGASFRRKTSSSDGHRANIWLISRPFSGSGSLRFPRLDQ